MARHASVPATIETTAWLAAGGGDRGATGSSDGFYSLGIGGELTLPLSRFGKAIQYGGQWELRWGPWVYAETEFPGWLADGGLELTFGQLSHAQWGTGTLRVGAGRRWSSASTSDRATNHATVTVAWGVHSFLRRYHTIGCCVFDECTRCDPEPSPHAIDFGSVAQLFFSYRPLLTEAGWQWTLGIELSPTFFLPPYSGSKWIGAPP